MVPFGETSSVPSPNFQVDGVTIAEVRGEFHHVSHFQALAGEDADTRVHLIEDLHRLGLGNVGAARTVGGDGDLISARVEVPEEDGIMHEIPDGPCGALAEAPDHAVHRAFDEGKELGAKRSTTDGVSDEGDDGGWGNQRHLGRQGVRASEIVEVHGYGMGAIGLVVPDGGRAVAIEGAATGDVPQGGAAGRTLVQVDEVALERRFEEDVRGEDETGRWLSEHHNVAEIESRSRFPDAPSKGTPAPRHSFARSH